MEEEIRSLKEEISLLTSNVELLERKERQRKAMLWVKLLLKIVLILASIYGIYRAYDYLVKEVPNIMEEKIKELNPFSKYT